MLDNHNWIFGGNSISKIIYDYDTKKSFTYEIKDNYDKNAIAKEYIGLMYLNDFRYAASSNYWNLVGNIGQSSTNINDYRTSKNDNWLSQGLYEWTITKTLEVTGTTFRIDAWSCLGHGYKDLNHAVRPVMYLKNNIKRVFGNGTINNPYQITI